MPLSDTGAAVCAAAVLDALGGRDNVLSIGHCMTRLRLRLRDPAAVGVLRRADGEVHIVIGPSVRPLAREMETLVK